MGTPKGLLTIGGEPLLTRLIRQGREAGLEPVLVGRADDYAHLAPEVPRIADALDDAGPIGGLAALIGTPFVAIACDMPHLTSDDLNRLARDPRDAEVVAARRDDWEPLFARYAPSVRPRFDAYLQTGRRSLRGLLDRCEVVELAIDPAHLRDWDSPDDRVP